MVPYGLSVFSVLLSLSRRQWLYHLRKRVSVHTPDARQQRLLRDLADTRAAAKLSKLSSVKPSNSSSSSSSRADKASNTAAAKGR